MMMMIKMMLMINLFLQNNKLLGQMHRVLHESKHNGQAPLCKEEDTGDTFLEMILQPHLDEVDGKEYYKDDDDEEEDKSEDEGKDENEKKKKSVSIRGKDQSKVNELESEESRRVLKPGNKSKLSSKVKHI